MDARTRNRARIRAGDRCEYCQLHQSDDVFSFHVEHIIPIKHNGTDKSSNLAWSCHNCNLGKGANIAGLVDGKMYPLFNPRKQNWNRHFKWSGPVLVGKTKSGRATVQILNINADDRVVLREILMDCGLFPAP